MTTPRLLRHFKSRRRRVGRVTTNFKEPSSMVEGTRRVNFKRRLHPSRVLVVLLVTALLACDVVECTSVLPDGSECEVPHCSTLILNSDCTTWVDQEGLYCPDQDCQCCVGTGSHPDSACESVADFCSQRDCSQDVNCREWTLADCLCMRSGPTDCFMKNGYVQHASDLDSLQTAWIAGVAAFLGLCGSLIGGGYMMRRRPAHKQRVVTARVAPLAIETMEVSNLSGSGVLQGENVWGETPIIRLVPPSDSLLSRGLSRLPFPEAMSESLQESEEPS